MSPSKPKILPKMLPVEAPDPPICLPGRPRTLQFGSRTCAQSKVAAQKRPKRVPVSPGAGTGDSKRRISGRLGPPGGRPGPPKSVENRKKSLPGGVRLEIIFGTSVLIDFGRVFRSEMDAEIDDFLVRSRKAQIRKSIDFPMVFLRFWRLGASKIRRKTVAKRSWSRHACRTAFRDGFGTL